MSVDLNTPTDESLEVVGVLDKWNKDHHKPDDWIQNLIQRVHKDIQAHTPSNPNRPNTFDWDGYSKEEKDAYTWYSDEVIETEHWKKIVNEYKAKSANKDNVQYDHAPADGNNYGLNGNNGFVPPVVHEWSDSAKQGNGVAVNTQALRYFAKQLEAIEPDGTGGVAWQAWEKLNKVSLKPGGFAKAELLRQKINGTGGDNDGLRGDTMDTLMAVHQAVYNLRKSLIKIADEYDSAEELNKMTGDQLTEAMKTAWAEIEKLKNSGTGSSTDLPKGTPDPQFT
jgi:hypothetical protein